MGGLGGKRSNRMLSKRATQTDAIRSKAQTYPALVRVIGDAASLFLGIELGRCAAVKLPHSFGSSPAEKLFRPCPSPPRRTAGAPFSRMRPHASQLYCLAKRYISSCRKHGGRAFHEQGLPSQSAFNQLHALFEGNQFWTWIFHAKCLTIYGVRATEQFGAQNVRGKNILSPQPRV